MARRQASVSVASLGLVTRRLGPLPLVNHVLERLGLPALLERAVPTEDRRVRISHARCLGVLLRSLIVEREPVYREADVVATFAPELFGLEEGEAAFLGDDRLGRALDRLFDADRATLFTEVALAMNRRMGVAFDRFHNDSTTIKFHGRYKKALGRSMRGQRALAINFGHSKDRRPDLRQLLFILTTTDDGHVPVAFRCADGNTADVTTHRETWEGLRQLTGTTKFLYIADAKLCDGETMEHIARQEGKFLTVLPRSRREDAAFRRFVLTHEIPWTTVRDRENPRSRCAPRDVWRVWRSDVPSREGWPITWLFSSLLAQRQATTRQEHIDRAKQELAGLEASLASPRSRLRNRAILHDRLRTILTRLEVTRYLRVKVATMETHKYRQTGPGRPGTSTTYRRLTKKRHTISWTVNTDQVEQDHLHDGMFPLLSNDKDMSAAAAFQQYKRQPHLEARFRQLKDPMEIAPVFLKNEGRIEAFFCLYALALMVQALLEREIRQAMQREKIASLPLYPEARASRFPTTTQMLRLFALIERHEIAADGEPVKTIHPTLTPLQKEVLRLLGIPTLRYRTEPT